MAKFTKELAKLFRKITNSEIDAEGNAHVVLSPADSLLINNARIALASLEAEAVGEVIEQQSGMMLDGLVISEKPTYRNIKGIHNMKMMPLGTKFYTAPPAPVVPAPTSNSSSAFEDFWSNFEHPFAEDDELKSFASEIYRAAMLQGDEPVSDRDELTLDYLQGHKDGLEWAAQLAEANHPQTGDWLYDDPIELAKAIRKGPDMPDGDGNSLSKCSLREGVEAIRKSCIPVDVDKIQSECDAGNSPVTPDGWIPVSERMPDDDDFVYIWPRPDFGIELHVGQYCECHPKGDGWYAQVYEQNYGIEWHPIIVTHWMPLPAAPQQEA